jgi:hypothetical protein
MSLEFYPHAPPPPHAVSICGTALTQTISHFRAMTSATQRFHKYFASRFTFTSTALVFVFSFSCTDTWCLSFHTGHTWLSSLMCCVCIRQRRCFYLNLRCVIRCRNCAHGAVQLRNLKAAFLAAALAWMNWRKRQNGRRQSKWPPSRPRIEMGTSKRTNPQRCTNLFGRFGSNVQLSLRTILQTVSTYTKQSAGRRLNESNVTKTVQHHIKMAYSRDAHI